MRTDAGVFDVSHMGELEVEGPRARELLQGALSNDLDRLEPGQAQYTLLTNEDGGIIDDLIVYRVGDCSYLLVVNASNRANAYAWLKEREIRGSDVRDVSDDCALLAVQGPRAIERLGLPPAECVFVDDHEPNVKAAQDVGMPAVLFRVDRGDDLRVQLRALGVAPGR